MKIQLISDTHGYLNRFMPHPDANLIIHAGDFTIHHDKACQQIRHTDVPFPLGVPTKNLVKSLSFTIDKEENSDFNYSYTYDSDGYVTTIAEQTYIKDNNTQTTILTNDQYNWADLHGFIERIQSGTEKNFSYKLISDTNGKYVFEILQLIKVTKDTNDKPIDLTVEKVYHHTIHYTENNGVRTNQNLELKIMLNERKTASYQITY